MKKTILKTGLFRKTNTNNERKGELNIDSWIKRVFKNFGIAFIDPCCPIPDNAIPKFLNVPVSFDVTSDRLKQWNSSTGQFEVINSITQNSVTIEGLLSVSHIESYSTEKTIKIDNPLLLAYDTPFAANVTATLTAAQLGGGRITSTSAAAVSLTLPTATLLAPVVGASAGSRFQFIVDNSAGANTVTLDLTGTGITVGTVAVTGGGALTVSVANVIGLFELFFTSGTTAIIRRIA